MKTKAILFLTAGLLIAGCISCLNDVGYTTIVRLGPCTQSVAKKVVADSLLSDTLYYGDTLQISVDSTFTIQTYKGNSVVKVNVYVPCNEKFEASTVFRKDTIYLTLTLLEHNVALCSCLKLLTLNFKSDVVENMQYLHYTLIVNSSSYENPFCYQRVY